MRPTFRSAGVGVSAIARLASMSSVTDETKTTPSPVRASSSVSRDWFDAPVCDTTKSLSSSLPTLYATIDVSASRNASTSSVPSMWSAIASVRRSSLRTGMSSVNPVFAQRHQC